MEEKITKEKADEIMKIKGESTGLPLRADADFIVRRKKEGDLEKIEKRMRELGYPIKYREAKIMGSFPIGYRALTLLLEKEILGFTEEDFKKMGAFGPRLPTTVRLFMKFLGSLEKLRKEAPRLWKKYYSIGEVSVPEMDEEKKRGVVKLEGFKLVSPHCQVLRGYFSSLLEMVVKSETSCQEIKCPFQGDEYYEFLLKW